MAFPGTLDQLTAPGLTLDSPPHHRLHEELNAGLAAVQAKLGVNDSDDAASIDYRLTKGSSPGHTHAAAEIAGLAAVATSGSYLDLTNRPALGALAAKSQVSLASDVTGLLSAALVSGLAAVSTTGAYADLSGKPTLSAVAASGNYADLAGRPALGSLAAKNQANLATDVTGLLPAASVSGLAAVATSGSYADLSNKPAAVTPGGTTGQVQFNNAGAFAGSANFVWNNASSILGVAGSIGLTGQLNVVSNSTALDQIRISGKDSVGNTDPNAGVQIGLANNTANNRQITFGPWPSTNAEAFFRMYFVLGQAGMDAYSKDGTRRNLYFGTDTTNVYFGATAGITTVPNDGKNFFLGEAGKATVVAQNVAGQTGDTFQTRAADGTLKFRVNAAGDIRTSKVDSAGGEIIFEQLTDEYGPCRFYLRNRTGMGGGLFENLGLDLSEFGFKTMTGAAANFRFERRSPYVSPGNGTYGELQFLLAPNVPTPGAGTYNFMVGTGVVALAASGAGASAPYQQASAARVGINTQSPAALLHTLARYAAEPTEITQAVSGQTAKLREYRSAAGGVVASVSPEGDVEIADSARGVILKSPNATRWRVQATNAGALTATSL